ncbi:MAG: MBOAT family protein, partial [Actinomycetota bacterium]|nr:MBOAT family protein [Actinomycetota bacterium]
GKKVLIANTLAVPADLIFSLPPDQLTTPVVWFGVICYTLQIYFDFSGYSDMAIGLGKMLGFRLPENFNRPYSAVSITDFWRRWHMSLSRWFRDYLYIPLGGNRRGPRRTYVNLMLTMLLGGLWHGAAWTFLIWGGIHGGALAGERWLGERYPRAQLPRWVAWLITFNVVCLAWVFFRAPDLSTAFGMLGQIGAGGPSPLVTPVLVALTAGAVAIQAVPRDFWQRAEAWFVARPALGQGIALGALIVIADAAVGQQGVAPFIYFQF